MPQTAVATKLPNQLALDFHQFAIARGETRSTVIRAAIIDYMGRHEYRPKKIALGAANTEG
jgi:predicted transcriptional regulator